MWTTFGPAPALLASLVRCPLCRRAPSGPLGCCHDCRRQQLHPVVAGEHLWLGAHQGQLRRAVLALKYGRARRLARHLGASLAAAVSAHGWQPECVCPVPSRRRAPGGRAYNHSQALARAVAAELRRPYRAPLRRRSGASQVGLSRTARRANVAGAFASASLEGEVVLLVDDVLTTGATATACRSALLRAGAGAVLVAVVAKA